MLSEDIETVRASGLPLGVLERAHAELWRGPGRLLHSQRTCSMLSGPCRRITTTPERAQVWGMCVCTQDEEPWGEDAAAYLAKMVALVRAVQAGDQLRERRRGGEDIRNEASRVHRHVEKIAPHLGGRASDVAEQLMAKLVGLATKKPKTLTGV